MSWKNAAIVLALGFSVQTYRTCTRHAPKREIIPDCPKVETRTTQPLMDGFSDEAQPQGATAKPTLSGPSFHAYGFGVTVPPWAMFFVPKKGEDIRAYRDRLLPVAEQAIAPQRARVARMRDDLAQSIHMDAHQRAELDGATSDTASALENRVMAAFANGDFDPSTFKPMTGVTLAKDLIDEVDKGNQRWMSSLSGDQRGTLAKQPFDFADYMVFSTPWENLLKVFD